MCLIIRTRDLFYLCFKIKPVNGAREDSMIEVSASLVRGPVFLAGETLQCNITFTNTNQIQ